MQNQAPKTGVTTLTTHYVPLRFCVLYFRKALLFPLSFFYIAGRGVSTLTDSCSPFWPTDSFSLFQLTQIPFPAVYKPVRRSRFPQTVFLSSLSPFLLFLLLSALAHRSLSYISLSAAFHCPSLIRESDSVPVCLARLSVARPHAGLPPPTPQRLRPLLLASTPPVSASEHAITKNDVGCNPDGVYQNNRRSTAARKLLQNTWLWRGVSRRARRGSIIHAVEFPVNHTRTFITDIRFGGCNGDAVVARRML